MANPETTSREPALIEIRLNGSVVATCKINSEVRDVSRALGIQVMPLALRRIADEWEQTDA